MAEERDKDDVTYFAATNFRGQNRKFGIKTDDRRRHMYFIGKTGMGKSAVLKNMLIDDIKSGKGVAFIDPHGDTVREILDFIPPERINDVVYFNPTDIDKPIAFNILENVDPRYNNLVASGLVGVFKKIWADTWGPRLEYILMNTILALIEYPGSTLLGVTRILVDKQYRKKVVSRISDPVVKSFWVDEYANYNERFRTEAIAPIQNKVGQFLSSALIRNIVGQPKSTIDVREIMDSRKIFLVNLAKGSIGEENSALLGAMVITKLQLAAMSRVDIEEEERQDFYLYVDEFQNFATESFANILSEARKYRLNLIVAHQYIEQLDEKVAAAIFGNVGTMVCFRVGATDAEFLEKEFAPIFTEQDLVNLAKYNVYLKLMIDGVASEPFSATTLPPSAEKIGATDKVIKVSSERYSRPKEVVEDRIVRWSGVEETYKSVAREENISARGAEGGYREDRRPSFQPKGKFAPPRQQKREFTDRSKPPLPGEAQVQRVKEQSITDQPREDKRQSNNIDFLQSKQKTIEEKEKPVAAPVKREEPARFQPPRQQKDQRRERPPQNKQPQRITPPPVHQSVKMQKAAPVSAPEAISLEKALSGQPVSFKNDKRKREE